MKIEAVTTKRRISKTIADSKPYVFAWSALEVTLVMVGEALNTEIHVTMAKAELEAALAKITPRENEIKQLTQKDV